MTTSASIVALKFDLQVSIEFLLQVQPKCPFWAESDRVAATRRKLPEGDAHAAAATPPKWSIKQCVTNRALGSEERAESGLTQVRCRKIGVGQ
jgi:hypothetical protein